ncbi:WD40/YVTN/BNR-like repeat-containing protein [Legionella sp. D16C41]|uniref:WD40/YVTN/BNR-like repeat-containing protein n=1 Tax=Legionella sp. D16C41 TaxID=3402688 RepID=UPI003AF92184
MKNIRLITSLLSFLISYLVSSIGLAAPVFTLTPLTATTIQLPINGAATVQYLVQNQSSKTHTLVMLPIIGVTQITNAGNCPNPFVLGMKQSCVLTLQINANQLSGSYSGGPIVCQQGSNGAPNPLQCYQPSPTNLLNITVLPTIQYRINSNADVNGNIFPSGVLNVNAGANLLFTATPAADYIVYQWLVDGVVAQIGGTTFLLPNITANHNVAVNFTSSSIIYGGAQNGVLYYAFYNPFSGTSNWSPTPTMPANGSSINSVFATPSLLYTGNQNGFIYYSSNNGNSWRNTTPPDGSSVMSVFATANTLYAGTQNGNVAYSITNGSNWHMTTSPDGSTVNSVFVANNVIYAGTQNGYVYYSINNGATWIPITSQPDGSGIRNIFVNNNNLFVNTVNEFVYSSLSFSGNWNLVAQTAYSLFVDSLSNIFAGTQGGYVFLVTTGLELGFLTYSPINSVFVLN